MEFIHGHLPYELLHFHIAKEQVSLVSHVRAELFQTNYHLPILNRRPPLLSSQL